MPASTNSLLPNNLQAEKTVLGAILLDPASIFTVTQQISADDFYDPIYKRIFAACENMAKRGVGIDFLTVNQELSGDTKIQEIGGSAFLADLASSVPTASHVARYAEMVRGCSRKRAVIKAGHQITNCGHDHETSAQQSIEHAIQTVLNLSPMTSQLTEKVADIHRRRYETISELQANPAEAKKKQVFTGFSHLDATTGGLTPKTLSILAARPAMGKSALALNIAQNAADAGRKTMLFSAEMSKEEILDRMASQKLKVSFHDIQRGNLTDEQVGQHGNIHEEIKDLPLFIDDDYNCSINNLRHKAMQQQLRDGLDFLIIDYLQLLTVPKSELKDDSGYRTVSFISRALKQLARQLNIPIVALCQLSRQPENRNDPRPILSDLRDSGSIEQDADNVFMLFRQDYYNDPELRDGVVPGLTNLFIRKQRNGPTGVVDLMFDKTSIQFTTYHPNDTD